MNAERDTRRWYPGEHDRSTNASRTRKQTQSYTSCPLRSRSGAEDRYDLLSVSVERLLLRIVHQIDVELIHAHVFELCELRDVVLYCPKDAEVVHDVVGDEVGRGIACLAVVAVVVTLLAHPDVVGERVRHLTVLPVAGDQVGDVVADHAPEPPALVALVGQIVADVS